ncbi:MAG: amino acid adenylation domain-containing protein, partial [bacterium]|nr:amino acid adenylation domain-containing protein [bacterium]
MIKRNYDKLAAAAVQNLKEKDFWLDTLSGDLVKSSFLYDNPTDAVMVPGDGMETVEFQVTGQLYSQLMKLSKGSDVKLHMILTTGLFALLAKYTGNRDIIIGSPIQKQEMEIEFVNTVLTLRTRPEKSTTFKELLLATRTVIVAATEHQNYPLEVLLEQLDIPYKFDGGDFPLFDVVIVNEAIHDKDYIPTGYIGYKLLFSFRQADDRIEAVLHYNSMFYEETTIKRIFSHYTHLVLNAVTHADAPLSEAGFLSETEKKQILEDFNGVTTACPEDKTLHRLFAEQAGKNPDRIAVVDREEQISYAELNKKAGQLAGVLSEKGTAPGTNPIVGIMIEPGVEMMIGIMGILKAGAAYLPIDPDYPEERIDFMLKDSDAIILLTSGELKSRRDQIRNPKSETNPNNQNSNAPNKNQCFPCVVLNFEHSNFESCFTLHDFGFRISDLSPSGLAYIIYTSGTTGKPKGVMVEHRNAVAYVHSFYHEFNLTPDDIFLQQASFSFDVFVEEVFPILLTGGRSVIVQRDMLIDMERFSSFMLKQGITIISCSPLLLNEIDKLPDTGGIRIFINGGDVLKHEYIGNLLKKGGVYNTYGPTESTVCATYYRCSPDDSGSPPIGKPIANYSVYILGNDFQLLPIGVPGELCVAGAGVSRGYLNRPELTVERFIEKDKDFSHGRTRTNTDKHGENEKVYLTGDLARWLPDGNIEFLGRIDHQVKIRGYRIELGEIENRLLKHQTVKDTVVAVKENDGGDRYLCAYMVTVNEKELNAAELKDYLSGDLPDYMIPAYFVSLDRFPLTATGKVDRKSLPEPVISREKNYVAPRDEVESLLTDIWSEVLEVDRDVIGIDSDFFELGGFSWKATVLLSRIHRDLQAKIPLWEVFRAPTIRELARCVKESGTTDSYLAVEPVEKKDHYALSSAQKRLYFLQQMDPGSISYNMSFVFPLGKEVDVLRLETTFKQLILHHESLRTSFVQLDSIPVQCVVEVSEIDFSFDYFQSGREERGPVIRNYNQPFDLTQAPLFRCGLIEFPDGNYTWLLNMHHIISDGTSITVLTEDFFALYAGGTLPEMAIQYKDFSQWQNHLFESGAIKEQQDYWLDLYRENVPHLDLPADFKRPGVFTFQGGHYGFKLDTAQAHRFKELNTRLGGTIYMNILAVLNTLFYIYTGQTDIIIGSGIAGRPHVDLQRIIGMFVNTLAMRNSPEGEKTYEAFLEEVIHRSLRAFENQDVQFEDLIDKLDIQRDPSRNPMFDVSMVVQNFKQPGEGVGGSGANDRRPPMEYKKRTAKFDLTFFVHERGDEVVITIEYYTGIFTEETAKRMAGHFKTIISEVNRDPAQQLKDILIITQDEKKRILDVFNDTAAQFPGHKGIHQLFEEQVAGTPDHVALVEPSPTTNAFLTYRQLDHRSDRLARYLHDIKNIQPGDRVGLLMSRGLGLPVSILGTLKSGGGYVPLDPALPEDRLKYMIDDSALGVVVSEKRYIKTLNRLQWECESFHSYLCLDSDDVHGEEEVERSQLMEEELWRHVGESATDEITGGGWVSSYTGEPFSREEMNQYGDNILKKLLPLVHPKMRVLEIGCASGITMFRIAPKVGLYYGTDLSGVIIDKNRRRAKEEGHQNIKLAHLAAHEVHKLDETNFDLIIINSVIQCFHGHNYLRKIIRQCVALLGGEGYLFAGDLMDQGKKAALQRDLTRFKQAHPDNGYSTKTDLSSELFVSRRFWTDLAAEPGAVRSVEFSDKIHTIENELTKFRYDALITIAPVESGKGVAPPADKEIYQKKKYQDDARVLDAVSPGKPGLKQSSTDLAYIIYTSGTTGWPKGVMVGHRGISNLKTYHREELGISPTDRVLQFANPSFDASVAETVMALLNGAALYIVGKEIIGNYNDFSLYLEKYRVTAAILPPPFLLYLDPRRNYSLKIMITAGSETNFRLVRQWNENIQYINAYGPTETTIWATSWIASRGDGDPFGYKSVPIGKPIFNTQIYILDKYDRVQAVGVSGELCIGGTGVAGGYLNKPELTADRFVNYKSQITNKTPAFSVSPGVIYKTGDLARWLEDGNVEFLGRIDQQVKVRGFRIELGEIETRLSGHESVSEAVVIDRVDEEGEKYLCAYLVPVQGDVVSQGGEIADSTEYSRYLSRTLPEYMIPVHFTAIEKVPLTVSGKVDRSRLPLPRPDAMRGSGTFAPPGDVRERKLVHIWSEVLRVGEQAIGIDDNFFKLGGHSLKATILVSKIEKELAVKVPLAEVFNHQTIRELSRYIGTASAVRYSSIRSAEKKEYYPLSAAQKRLYIIQQMDRDSTRYNMKYRFPLGKEADPGRLENTFIRLMRRHESLRTSFHLIRDFPVQVIHDHARFRLGGGEWNSPFDLSKAPLFRVELLNKEAGEHILRVEMHHIISDGTSQEVLKREFTALYQGRELPPLPLQYKDFAVWQDSDRQRQEMNLQETFWLEQFPGDLPVLDLPYDFPRPMVPGYRGRQLRFLIGPGETRQLKELSLRTGSTFYMILSAACGILLSKLSRQEDIVIGTPIAARKHADLQDIIGMFVNTLAIRNYPEGKKTLSLFLDEVKEHTLEVYENQDYPFEELVDKVSVERDTSRNPIFDIMFNFLNQVDYQVNSEDWDFDTIVDAGAAQANFDMTFLAAEMDGVISLSVIYSTRLYKQETIERFITYFKRIVSSISNMPDRLLADVDYIPEEEKERLLFDFNRTDAAYEEEGTIHGLFEEQVERNPDRVALTGGNREKQLTYVTYNELNRRAEGMAGLLIEKGVEPGVIAAVMLERSLDLIVGIFGILKAGGAYLPIDPGYPHDRVQYMLKDSCAKVIVTNGLEVRKTKPNDANELPNQQTNKLTNQPTNLAYIIYTSGTTGKPKGVMIEHRGISSLKTYHQRELGVLETDRVLQFAGVSFDASVAETVMALLNGAALYIVSKEIIGDYDHFSVYLERYGITMAILPPPFLVHLDPSRKYSLRKLITAGSETNFDLVHRWNEDIQYINAYGPTETTIWATSWIASKGDGDRFDYKSVPIGKPIYNTQIYIFDKYGQPQAIGVPGELCIGGVGIARGYLNQPVLTSEKFLGVRNPFFKKGFG